MLDNAGACEISIIVPVYNGENKIQSCLDALLREDLSRCEVIIVDNASTDRTAEQAKSYQKFGVSVYKVGPPSRGLARHYGIEKSKGKIVVMVDCDCVVEPGWLRKITKPVMDGNSKLVIGRTIGMEPKSWGKLAENAEKKFLFQRNELGQNYNFTSTQFAIARSCLNQVSFDPQFKSAEDFDFGIKCFLKNIKVNYCESALVAHNYLNDFKGQMLKSMSRGYWSFFVFKKYDDCETTFKNQIRKNKGLEYYRFGYTVIWALFRLIKLLSVNKEKKDLLIYETSYALSWQLGVFYARCNYFLKTAGKSKFSVRRDPVLKEI